MPTPALMASDGELSFSSSPLISMVPESGGWTP